MKNRTKKLIMENILFQTIFFLSPLILGGIMFIITSNSIWILIGILGLFLLYIAIELLFKYLKNKQKWYSKTYKNTMTKN